MTWCCLLNIRNELVTLDEVMPSYYIVCCVINKKVQPQSSVKPDSTKILVSLFTANFQKIIKLENKDSSILSTFGNGIRQANTVDA